MHAPPPPAPSEPARRMPSRSGTTHPGTVPSGRPRTVGDDRVAYVIERTLHATPPDTTHWSPRPMAGEDGLAQTTVRRVRNAFGRQPHRSETFKLSGDPAFADKVRDIVGLHLSPSDQAVMLRVDGKSRIRAPGRTQPVPPLRPGIPERRTHGYRRNGTISPFAATGFVIGSDPRRGSPGCGSGAPIRAHGPAPNGPGLHAVGIPRTSPLPTSRPRYRPARTVRGLRARRKPSDTSPRIWNSGGGLASVFGAGPDKNVLVVRAFE